MRQVRRVLSECAQQVEIVFKTHGGKREGAGRKRITGRRRVAHCRRKEVTRHKPVHVTLRVLNSVGRLRKLDAYRAIRQAMIVAHERADFRIVHVSIQSNHVHLICEADSRTALSRGMSSLKISTARRLNRVLRRTGAVFADRYHSEIIGCPLQARNTICYVLNNWRRHQEDRGLAGHIDRFSSAIAYRDWAEGWFKCPPDYEPLPVKPAQSWLLAYSWQGKYAPISQHEVPGPLNRRSLATIGTTTGQALAAGA